ncbi:MAG: gamma-glutamyl phosphate reductase [Myxococcaceae bacterium]|nr:gamma-glutamyl phosphate reductase [Myxococcaceae bacterium]
MLGSESRAMPEPDLKTLVRQLAVEAKQASRVLASVSTAKKNAVLRHVAEALRGPAVPVVLEANERDLGVAQDLNLSAAMVDRLRLDPKRIATMASDLEAVLGLPDPVGRIESMHELESGIRAGRMSVPLGVIAIIYESRPNVTADAAALCIKSGNACILRGGKEAFHSSQALANLFDAALLAEDLPRGAVSFIPTTQREATLALLGLDDLVDLAIPRGGESLIRFVTENARVPVLKHYKGVVHVYVDDSADYAKAERIILNGKVQRPSACNAAETLLVARSIAPSFVPRLCAALALQGVQIRGCDETHTLYPESKLSPGPEYDTEYTDMILNVRVVDSFEGGLGHIAAHGSRHTDVIVTEDYSRAQRFLREVDASAVMINASPRFNDGGQLGLGAEIGISTTKLHAYGPMGLAELCTKKWIVYGDGQIRA